MGKVLDLIGADTSGGDFPALPAGTYNVYVSDAEWGETQGSEGAVLPKGTAQLMLEFTIDEEEDNKGRKFWRNYQLAPAKINGKKNDNKAKTDGILARAVATIMDVDVEAVTTGEYELDVQDMIGQHVRVVVSKQLKRGRSEGDGLDGDPYRNEVKGIKPLGAGSAAGSGLI